MILGDDGCWPPLHEGICNNSLRRPAIPDRVGYAVGTILRSDGDKRRSRAAQRDPVGAGGARSFMQTRKSGHEVATMRNVQHIVERDFEERAIARSKTFDKRGAFRRGPDCDGVIDR